MDRSSDKYLDLVKKIILDNIPKEKFNIFLFGSRAKKYHRSGADIDVGVKGSEPLNPKIIFTIKDIIEESIVPFKVDIIDFYKVSEDFKKEALKDIKIWNQTKTVSIK